MSRLIWVALLCGSFTLPASAQPRFGGGGSGAGLSLILDSYRANGTAVHFLLLDQPAIQQELRATPEQVQRAKQFNDMHRQTLSGLGNLPREENLRRVEELRQSAERELKAILSPGQFHRLQQISLQQIGPLAIGRPEVSEAVGLSAEQQRQIRGMQEHLVQAAMQNLPQPGAGGRPKLREIVSKAGELNEVVARLQATKRDAEVRTLALLSEEQKMKWSQVQGAPFQGQLSLSPGASKFLGRQ
jgi:hypothetical protein